MKNLDFLTLVLFGGIFLLFIPIFGLNVASQNKISFFEKSVVWDVGENNVDGYRIPGIVVTAKGTVLAVAEERPKYGDADQKSIVLKRSEDEEKTWSENIYIETSDGNFWSQNSEKIDFRDEPDKYEVWTNPALLVDKQTGRIFIFYALSEGKVAQQNLQRYTRVFYKFSDDDGLSWSDRIEITEILNANEAGSPNRDENGNWITDDNGFPCDYLGRAFHMPGPGHGIQLSNGRLLLQVWNRTALGIFGEGAIPKAERAYGLCIIYSDDHGKSWRYETAFGHEGLNAGECRLAELKNGNIYLNSRNGSNDSNVKNVHRVTAISNDNGINWTDIKIDMNFPPSNSCDAGLICIERKGKDKNWLLYSKNESLDGRKNLVVRLSYDEGQSWPVSKVVDEGPAWYSDLAVLPDNSILLIYETGKGNPVYSVRFNLQWLTDECKEKSIHD